MFADDTLSSTTEPTDYTPPIMVHRANNTWISAGTSKPINSTTATYIVPYLVPPFTKGNLVGHASLITSATPTSLPSNVAGFGIQLGNGITPATYDDYKLESTIVSGLTLVSQSGTLKQATIYDSETHHISSERTYTINNSSSNSITVSEVGIYAPFDSSGNCCLIYRDVFSPVTLAPGESIIISFKKDGEVYNYTPYSS